MLRQHMTDDLLTRQMQNPFRGGIIVSDYAGCIDCYYSLAYRAHHSLQLFCPDLMWHQIDRYDIQHLGNRKQSRHHLLPDRCSHRFQFQVGSIRLYFH